MAELIVYGIVLGAIIALGAIGLSLVYGILRFANFAHGDIMTVGAYVGLLMVGTLFPALGVSSGKLGPLSFGWPMLVAFLPAMAITSGAVIMADQVFFRTLRGRRASPILLAMASLALAFVFRSIVLIIWGPDFHFYTTGLRPSLALPLGIRLKPDDFFVFATAITLVILVYLFLERTKMGKALRATADNPSLARVSGINTEQMIIWTWGIAGALAAAAGILLGIQSQVRPEMGWGLLLPLFAAVILGGIGNPYGALVGGMVIGIAQQVSTAWLLPTYKPAVAFAILIIILLFRPQGIFGSRYGT
jgi:branched-chain amino acid transport system permease protein/neutral amino acid transport system permease protein